MLKTTCASIIAAAALAVVPVAAQAQGYDSTTSMSTEAQGTTGTGDQYMRTQENYTRSAEEAHFEATGQRLQDDPRYSEAQEPHQTHAGADYQASPGSLDEARQTTGTGVQYMRTQENYTRSQEEAYFDATGQRIRNDPRYGDGQQHWDETDRHYGAHQQALVPGSSNDAYWASDSLTNQSREGFVGSPYMWDSNRYFADPSMN